MNKSLCAASEQLLISPNGDAPHEANSVDSCVALGFVHIKLPMSSLVLLLIMAGRVRILICLSPLP